MRRAFRHPSDRPRPPQPSAWFPDLKPKSHGNRYRCLQVETPLLDGGQPAGVINVDIKGPCSQTPSIRITCKHVPATCLLTCSSTRVMASSNGQNTRASSFFNISEYANGGCRGGLCRFEGYLTACLVKSSLMLPSDPPWPLSVRRRYPSKEGVLGRSTREDSRGITFSQA